jgi:large subunit ribosomal protein L12
VSSLDGVDIDDAIKQTAIAAIAAPAAAPAEAKEEKKEEKKEDEGKKQEEAAAGLSSLFG